MTNKTQVVIAGAGLAGLSAALHLESAKEYSVFEREETPGGLCRSVQRGGFTFDYTGHLLHLKTDEGRCLVGMLLGENLAQFQRRARIFSKGVWTAYPFQANTYGLPDEVSQECVEGIRAVRDQPVDRSNYHRWIETTFGNGIAKHFMIPYNEKLWCVELDQLTCDWAGGYIPRPTIQEVEEGARAPRGERAFGYNASFLYPKEGGIQSLINAMVNRLPAEALRFGEGIASINSADKTFKTSSGKLFSYEDLISTLPLKKLVQIITDVPQEVRSAAENLRAVSVYNLNLGVKGNRTDAHWAYFPEKTYPFYRIGFYHNFGPSMAPPDTLSYYVEVSFPQGKTFDCVEARRAVLEALKPVGLLDDESDILAEFETVIETGYVLYTHERDRSVSLIQQWLDSRGIQSLGRYGAWEYSAMEEALLEGRAAALRVKNRQDSSR